MQRGGRQEVVKNMLCRSYIWDDVKVLRLNQNMQIQSTCKALQDDYAEWLLQLGNGLPPSIGSGNIQLPSFMLLSCNTLLGLIDFVYTDKQTVTIDLTLLIELY